MVNTVSYSLRQPIYCRTIWDWTALVAYTAECHPFYFGLPHTCICLLTNMGLQCTHICLLTNMGLQCTHICLLTNMGLQCTHTCICLLTNMGLQCTHVCLLTNMGLQCTHMFADQYGTAMHWTAGLLHGWEQLLPNWEKRPEQTV